MLIKSGNSLLLVIDIQEKLLPAMSNTGQVLQNVGMLIAGAREMAVPVIASEQYPKGLGATVPEIAERLRPGERLEKIEFSCFDNPGLRKRIKQSARNQALLVGVEAHVCVLQTALGLIGAGMEVFVIADAVTSRQEASVEAACRRLTAAGAILVTAEMVIFEWLRRADVAGFKALSRLVR